MCTDCYYTIFSPILIFISFLLIPFFTYITIYRIYPFHQMHDITLTVQRVWLLVQALYVSSLLIIVLSGLTYVSFVYLNIDREVRNELLRIILAISCGLLVYLFCRIYNRMVSTYGWLLATFLFVTNKLKYLVNRNSLSEVN